MTKQDGLLPLHYTQHPREIVGKENPREKGPSFFAVVAER
jgi:hypothetical protein